MTPFEGPLAEAIALGREAHHLWKLQPWKAKAALLKRVSNLLVEKADELSAVVSKASGKTLTDALSTEIVPATLALRWYLGHGQKALRSHPTPGGNLLLANKRSRIHYQPYGVVGIISPWNYPFAIPFSEVVMALLAGNAVVLKVASASKSVGRAIAGLFAEAEFPKDLVQLSELPGAEAGPAMVKGGVDKLFFTGSVEVGQELMKVAAPRILPLVLELGGNDAAIVRADANLDLAVKGLIWAGLSNAGQSCGGAQRILVHQSVYEPFCRLLTQKVADLRIGEPDDFDTDVGQMISPAQKKAVESQVKSSVAGGARLLVDPAVDPKAQGKAWLTPRILVGVTPESPAWNEEVFGPVLVVVPFGTDEQAIALANDSSMGLTSSIWTRDHKTAKMMARQIRAGAVLVNDHLMSHGLAETPWGGFGASGVGRTHGIEGLREMVQGQVVVDDILPLRQRNPWWHPHSKKIYRGLKALQAFQYAPRWQDRLKALPRLMGLFFRYWRK